MRNSRRTHAALGANESDVAAQRLRFGIDEDRGDRSQEIGHIDRRDEIFGNAVADEIAIKCYVVVSADDDDTRGGIANLRQGREIVQQRGG
ncbi:hypothetical protein D3C78_965530 [compost metagenome]